RRRQHAALFHRELERRAAGRGARLSGRVRAARVVAHAVAVNGINFSWLIRLHWGAIAGQLVTIIGVDRLMHIRLPLGPLLFIVAVESCVNVGWALAARRREVAEWWAPAAMALDVVLLTALLSLSGGPLNPFSFLYLVEIALAAVILPARWTWAL